jgi:hypothetical protein
MSTEQSPYLHESSVSREVSVYSTINGKRTSDRQTIKFVDRRNELVYLTNKRKPFRVDGDFLVSTGTNEQWAEFSQRTEPTVLIALPLSRAQDLRELVEASDLHRAIDLACEPFS